MEKGNDGYYQIDSLFSIDKKRLLKKMMELRILIFSYVAVMLMLCVHNIMRLQINGMDYNQNSYSCSVFKSLFRNQQIAFSNSKGEIYLIFDQICQFLEIMLRTIYLNLLILKFFDKESPSFVVKKYSSNNEF